jgi:hypothetical protein
MKKQAHKQECSVQLNSGTYEGNIPQLCTRLMLAEQLQTEQKYHIPNLKEWKHRG